MSSESVKFTDFTNDTFGSVLLPPAPNATGPAPNANSISLHVKINAMAERAATIRLRITLQPFRFPSRMYFLTQYDLPRL
jgi:hypothetical protein